MKKKNDIYLHHILQSIHAIELYLKGISEKEFLSSTEKQDLISRRLEIIGEAAKQLPEDYKKNSPDIPWRDIGDMRNVLIHTYFDIDYKIVWETVTVFIPQLKKQIEELLIRKYE